MTEGEPCGGERSVCDGWDRVLACVDREWTEIDCAVFCEEEGTGLLLGCMQDDGSAECVCDALACGGESPACIGSDEVAECKNGEWEVTNCSDSCEALDVPLPSQGCLPSYRFPDACYCTRIGTPCDESTSPVCDSPRGLATCDEGVWALSECTGPCELEEVPACLPFEEGGPKCGCVPFDP